MGGGEHRAVIAREEGHEAFLSVPALACGSLLGALHLYHRAPHRHTPDEVALLSFLAEQAGIAILRCRLAERFQAVAGQLGALAALAGCVSGESSPEGLLARARLLVGEALGARECSITLGQPPAGDNVTPLLAGERVIGAIRVDRDRPLSSEERQFLSAAAAQLAMAIDNARLLSDCVEMRRALEARKLVERAKGILQQRHGLTEEEAYLRLRNESRRLRRPMRDLAEAVLLAEDLHRESP